MPKEKTDAGITQRFLLLMDEVLSNGLTKSKETFAATVGLDAQNLSPMQRGERSPTVNQCAAACLAFGYSANWLLLNTGPKKTDNELNIPIEKRVNDLEIKMRLLQRQFQQVSRNEDDKHSGKQRGKKSLK